MSLISENRPNRPLLAIQQSLNERFELQSQSNKSFIPKLGVKTSDGKGVLLSLEDFDETMMTEEVMSVGRIKPWVKGITSWRGRVFTLIDVSILFNCDKANDINPSPIFGSILNSKFEKPWALLWSGGNDGLMDTAKFKIEPNKDFSTPWFDEILTDENGQEWRSLNLAKLLTYEKLSKVL
jgi:chemotaxis signal transduction protein